MDHAEIKKQILIKLAEHKIFEAIAESSGTPLNFIINYFMKCFQGSDFETDKLFLEKFTKIIEEDKIDMLIQFLTNKVFYFKLKDC